MSILEPPAPTPPRAVAALLLGFCVAALPGAVFSVALPFHLQRLALPQVAAGVIATAYLYSLILAALPMAALTGRYGARMVFVAALAGVAVFSAAMTLPLGYPVLIALRVLQGAVTTGLVVAGFSLLRPVFGTAWLGLGFGLATMVAALSTGLLPVASALGRAWLGVGVLGVAVPGLLLAAVAMPLAWAALPRPRSGPGSFDGIGAALSLLCFGLLLAAATLAPFNAWRALMLVVLGVLVLAVWVWQQQGRAAPLLPLDLLAQPRCRRAVAAVFLAGMANAASATFAIQHLLTEWHVPADWLNAVFTMALLSDAAAAILGGIVADRWPRWQPVAAGGVLLAVGIGLLIHPRGGAGLAVPAALAIMLVTGAGRGLLRVGNPLALVGGAPPDRASAAAGMLVAAGTAGILSWPLLMVLPQAWLQGLDASVTLSVQELGLGLAGLLALAAAWLGGQAMRRQ